MSEKREERFQELVGFLRTIQKPDKPIDSLSRDDNLVSSGLIDSLAIIQIVVHLENTYGIDFAATGIDPERLATISSLLDLIEESQP
jgi:acyl carrier protein